MTLEQLQSTKMAKESKKNELLALREEGTISKEQDEQLENLLVELESIDDLIADKQSTGYTPKEGTEQMVHLKLIKGKRFDQNTGEEISKPYMQMFTLAEYQLVKEHCRNIGVTILEELYNPYSE